MNKENIIKILEELDKERKRNFSQTYDLIINLKHFDPKKNNIDFFDTLPKARKKKLKICALVGQELEEKAKESCDFVIIEKEFESYGADKKKIKQLAQKYDIFLAQANLMAKIAKAFGRVLGSRGKMPNPKAGAIVPPNADLKVVSEKLRKTVRMNNKKQSKLQTAIGDEGMSKEDVADNIISLFNHTIKQLPAELNNIKSVMLKKTMSKPMRMEFR